QVRALAAAGVREVVFLGQTVNAYHDGAWDFAELLRRAAEVPGILRIRFTSPHPSDMSPRVIEAMAECPPVAPQLHLPVQSGSDRVLDRMGREYTAAGYEDLVARLRARVPDLALSTDVIVGFPGEDEDDFASTEALVRRVRYDSAFLFKYSPREGTRAWKWGDTVPEDEKRRRLQRLVALQEGISTEINRRLAGAEVEVLVEGDRKSTRLNSSHRTISYVVFCSAALPDPHSFPTRRSSDRRYDSAFLFKYSPREGTRAWKWGDTVPEDEKRRRLQRLVALQEGISTEINRRLAGAEVEVLVEGPARRTAGWMAGKSPQMKTVVFPGPAV